MRFKFSTVTKLQAEWRFEGGINTAGMVFDL